MKNRDKYTYLALMALGMFGVGFWMMSVGGGLGSKPPAVPNPMAASQNVGSQFTGALTFGEGNEEIDEFFEENFLMPDDFARIGAVNGGLNSKSAVCLPGEQVVRNYLRPNESAFYISAAEDLTAREMIKRVQPVEFFYWMLHFDSESNRWSELGTQVIADNSVNSVVEEQLDEYVVRAGEPVLVYLFGMRADEDVEMRLQDGQLERQVIIKHCDNSFPEGVYEMNEGWNLTVADLVPIASNPAAQQAFSVDFLAGVQNLDLNGVQALANQFEGVLSWVYYNSTLDRPGFDIEKSNLPRVGFDLVSDPEVDTSGLDDYLTLAKFELTPANSPKIAAVALQALNLGDVYFSEIFENVAFRLNGRLIGSAADLDSDTLVVQVDMSADEIFRNGVAELEIVADPVSQIAVENLFLKLSLDLTNGRVANTFMPPLFIEFESVVAEVSLSNPNDGISVNDMVIAGDQNIFNVNVSISNETSNQVTLSEIVVPFERSQNIRFVNMIQGPNLLLTQQRPQDVEQNAAFDDERIYLFPGRQITLESNQRRIIPLSFYVSADASDEVSLEFAPMQMDTNSVALKVDELPPSLTYVPLTVFTEDIVVPELDDPQGGSLPAEDSQTAGDQGPTLPDFSEQNQDSQTADESQTSDESQTDENSQTSDKSRTIGADNFEPPFNGYVSISPFEPSSESLSFEYDDTFLYDEGQFDGEAIAASFVKPFFLGVWNPDEDLQILGADVVGLDRFGFDVYTKDDFGRLILFNENIESSNGELYLIPNDFRRPTTFENLVLRVKIENPDFAGFDIALPALEGVPDRVGYRDFYQAYIDTIFLDRGSNDEHVILSYVRELFQDYPGHVDNSGRVELPDVEGLTFKTYSQALYDGDNITVELTDNTPRMPGEYYESIYIVVDPDYTGDRSIEFSVDTVEGTFDYNVFLRNSSSTEDSNTLDDLDQPPSLDGVEFSDVEESNAPSQEQAVGTEQDESQEQQVHQQPQSQQVNIAVPLLDLENEVVSDQPIKRDNSAKEDETMKDQPVLKKLLENEKFLKALRELKDQEFVVRLIENAQSIDELFAELERADLEKEIDLIKQFL